MPSICVYCHGDPPMRQACRTQAKASIFDALAEVKLARINLSTEEGVGRNRNDGRKKAARRRLLIERD